MGFFIGSLLVHKFFFSYKSKYFLEDEGEYKKINIKNFILIFILFFSIFYSLNFYFGFYQKGIVASLELNSIFDSIIRWLFIIGIPSISTLLIYFTLNKMHQKYRLKIIYIAIFEAFLSSISQLSRAMIFNPLSIIFGLYKYTLFKKNTFSLFNFIKSYSFLVVLFIICILTVTEFNFAAPNMDVASYLDVDDELQKDETKNVERIVKTGTNQLLFLAGNRWVGVEGVMAVEGYPSKSLTLFKESFSEKFNYSFSFYEAKIKNSKWTKIDDLKYMPGRNFIRGHIKYDKKLITIYTPGIFAFLYYSGSLIIVFFCTLILYLFCSMIEIWSFFASKKNLIFCSLIGNILAYRLVHFGYMPLNTWKILLAIIITVIMTIIINRFMFITIKK